MNIATRFLNKLRSTKNNTKLVVSNKGQFTEFLLYKGSKVAAQCDVKSLDNTTLLIGWIESRIPSEGYASMLLLEIISQYTNKGIKVFKALIDSDKNLKSVKLFKSAGFKEVVHRNDRTSDWELRV